LTNHNFNAVQQDTGISPRIVRKYLEQMKKDHLIKEEAKDWKPGRSKPCYLSKKGKIQLVRTSLFEMLKVITKVLEEAKKPTMQENFLKMRTERVNQTESLIKQHFIDSAKRGVDPFTELEDLDEFDLNRRFGTSSLNGAQPVSDMDMPLYEATKKLFELQLFFNYQLPDPEIVVNDNWVIFAPKMLLFFMCKQGTRTDLDKVINDIENEAMKSHDPC
jgi:hypothetical protein